MGIFQSLLKTEDPEPINFTVNFKAKPSAKEGIHSKCLEITTEFTKIIERLDGYQGCTDSIRVAISSPSKENDEKCWGEILPAVSSIKDLYDFTQRLEPIFLQAVTLLCEDEPSRSIENYQATACQVSYIISAALKFDLIKMSNPNIQNDFSYYRRTVNRMKQANPSAQYVVSDELANKMSLFFAYSNPVTKCLTDALVNSKSIDHKSASNCFAILAAVSYYLIKTEQKVMVSSILLYDHLDPIGAFTKNSEIKMKATVNLINTHAGVDTNSLMSVLKFSTVHLNSETTPKSIKQLFA